MSTAAEPLGRALFERLNGAVAVDVYDHVPEPAEYPYVLLGDIGEAPSEAHDRGGVEATVTVHVYTRYRGYQQGAQILARVHQLLHRQPLAVAGHRNVSVAQQQYQHMRDPDPEIRHAWARYRIWLEENPPPADDAPENE